MGFDRADPQRPAGRRADGGSPLEMEWIEDESRWRELRSGWDDLVLASENPSIFNTWDFLEVSWSVFARPRGDRLAVLVLREEGRLLGAVPLRVAVDRRFGLVVRKLKRLASWEADRVPFVFPKGREREGAEAFLRFLDCCDSRWDSLELREVAAYGGFAAALRAWARGRGDVLLREQGASPSPYVRLEGSWQGFLSGLGARTRKGFRRRLRHLEELGPFRVEAFSDPADIAVGLDRYLEVEARSWKPSAGQGIGKNDRNREFYRCLLPRLATRGRARVTLLEQSGHLLAGLVELRLGSTVYASQTAFDRSYAHHAPGFVLQGLRLESCLAEGVQEYELFAKYLGDKLRWTKRLRPSSDVTLLRWRGVRRLLLFAGSRFKWLVRRPEAALTPPSEGGGAEAERKTPGPGQ